MSTCVKHMFTCLTYKNGTHVCHIKRAHLLTYILYICKTYVIFNMNSTRVLHMLNTFLTYVKHVFN